MARILKCIPDAWVSVSATTRKPRPGEIDGVHYYFMDKAHFDDLVKHDGFLEWANVHTAQYGTPRKSVEEHIAAGDQVILEIDVQGAFQVKKKMPGCHLVFIMPPSMDELKNRLQKRGTEDQETINARMEVAKGEVKQKEKYDFAIVNDDLDRATDELVDYIERHAGKDEPR